MHSRLLFCFCNCVLLVPRDDCNRKPLVAHLLRRARDSCPSRAHCRYQATRGYRLIAGNDCKAGVYSALGPLVMPCRSFTSAGFITALVVVIVALGAVFFAFKFQTGRNPESIQDVIDMVYVAFGQRVYYSPAAAAAALIDTRAFIC